jgi:class 3 adenylate cyclase/tetratricopeptide (TPR) repeat protein
MPCPRCQHENRPQAKFCEECAAPLARTCPNCGTPLSPSGKFCSECAHPVAVAAVGEARFASPQSYTPKHLAERILTSRSALEGERKQVTVLFADLKGSMELLADRDPEEACKLLDPVLERMMEAVHHYEGTVNQVMGDGIMALFGAPIGHEDHAVRACFAALRMQRRVNLYADEIQREGGTPVQIRVGLNSGEVVVRSIGSDLHMDYTAVGQTTHLAARMEQMARPGSTLVTGNTVKLAEGYVQARPLGLVPVRGLEAPTPVYELTGIVPARSRFQANAARGLTPFVGRESELQQLAQALGRAAAGHGQAVAVVGEAGVGKSRLVWEFTRSHNTHFWLVLESGSVSYGKATPYLPVIELLKAYCRIQERDDPRAIRERVTGKLLMLDRALEPLLTPLLALLDVPTDDAAWDGLDPVQRRQRTLEAVKRLLLRESQVQPLLVLFEDLHWIDAETQAVLDGLMENLPTARVLLLVNYRPEYQHAWGGKSYYRQLRIDPLPPESADELLETLLGPDVALGPLKRLLVERTHANPLFLEESVRALVETAALTGERGAYRLARPVEHLTIPATVEAILVARIDRLGPEAKRLLHAAAVIGKDVAMPLLLAIADAPELEVRAELTHLQAAGFLYETRLFPDLEYTFKHALTHEVAYGSLLQGRQRTLHARIVEAIERLYDNRLAEQVERLAHHAFRGEAWEKAFAYLRDAGAKAAARSANREAVAYFEQALVALARLPERRETLEEAIDVRLRLRNSLFPLGELEQVIRYLRQAETLAENLGDTRRLGQVLSSLTQYFCEIGDADQALRAGRRAQGIAEASSDLSLQVMTNCYMALTYHTLGEYSSAIEILAWNVERLAIERSRERFSNFFSVFSHCGLAWCLAEQGRFAEGIQHGREAARIADSSDNPQCVTFACVGSGLLYLIQGDLEQAAAELERGLFVCRNANLEAMSAEMAGCLGYVYALSERIDEALSLLEQVVAQRSTLPLRHHPRSLWQLSHAYLGAGRVHEARELGGRAVQLARVIGERAHEAYALRLLGEVSSHPDALNVGTAEGHYLHALALATELGMRPLLAHCHLGLGNLYRRTGKQQEAQDHLYTATTMYREMGMTFFLEKAEAALAPPHRNSP